MCPSQSRTVSSPWNWALPLRGILCLPVWKQLGKPKVDDVRHRYESASKHNLPVLRTFVVQTKDPMTGKQSSMPYIITKIPDLNLLGRNAMQTLGISADNAPGLRSTESQAKRKGVEAGHSAASYEPHISLQRLSKTL